MTCTFNDAGIWHPNSIILNADPLISKVQFDSKILITLRFLINVLDQISVLVGNFVKINKHTGPNKHTGAKILAQKYNFL